MAKPNYQFEKRQRDLAKKSKQEEKRRQKQAEKLIWCCEVSPDRDADPPAVLTVKEAKRKFNIDA